MKRFLSFLTLACMSILSVQAKNYTIQEVSSMRFSNPYVALPKLDSMARVGAASGWKEFSESSLETATALTYYYLDDWYDAGKHATRAMRTAKDSNPSDIYHKLVSSRILAYFYVTDGNWTELEKLLPIMDECVAKRPDMSEHLLKSPELYRLRIAAVRDHSDAALDRLNFLRDSLETVLSHDNLAYYTDCVRAINTVFKFRGYPQAERASIKAYLAKGEELNLTSENDPPVEQNRVPLTELRFLVRLVNLDMELGDEDIDETLTKALEIKEKHSKMPSVNRIYDSLLDALAKTVSEKNVTITTQRETVRNLRRDRMLIIALGCALLAIAIILALAVVYANKKNRILYERIEDLRKANEYQRESQTPNNKLLNRVNEHFSTNELYLDSELDIDEELKKLGTNRRAVNAVLRDAFDQNIGEYINALRLKHSLELLRDTKDSVEAVALDSGFNSVRTYLRLFKERYSLTPTQYRSIANSSKSAPQED